MEHLNIIISESIWTLHVLSSRNANDYVILKTSNIIRIETWMLSYDRHWNDVIYRYFRIFCVFFRLFLFWWSICWHLPGDLNSSLNLIGGWVSVHCSTMSSKRNESIVYLKSLKSSLLIYCASWFVSDIWNFPWKS